MKFLLTLTLAGGETLNAWHENAAGARVLMNLLMSAPGVEQGRMDRIDRHGLIIENVVQLSNGEDHL